MRLPSFCDLLSELLDQIPLEISFDPNYWWKTTPPVAVPKRGSGHLAASIIQITVSDPVTA